MGSTGLIRPLHLTQMIIAAMYHMTRQHTFAVSNWCRWVEEDGVEKIAEVQQSLREQASHVLPAAASESPLHTWNRRLERRQRKLEKGNRPLLVTVAVRNAPRERWERSGLKMEQFCPDRPTPKAAIGSTFPTPSQEPSVRKDEFLIVGIPTKMIINNIRM